MNSNPAKIIDAAKELLKQFGYFVDNLWHVDDIHFMCEQHGLPQISDAEAMEVFKIAKEQFDGEFGISWPQLDKAIRLYFQQKFVLNGIYESVAA